MPAPTMKRCSRRLANGERCDQSHVNSHPWCTMCRSRKNSPHRSKMLSEEVRETLLIILKELRRLRSLEKDLKARDL